MIELRSAFLAIVGLLLFAAALRVNSKEERRRGPWDS